LAAGDLEELHFTVIIPTYNNKDWYRKCLDSVRTQQYSNYNVIIIDDCSTDGQAQLIEQYINEYKLRGAFTLIKNSMRRFKMANLYSVIHQCTDNDIIIILDGDDWLSDPQVFNYFNSRYQCENIWITAGGYIEYPSGKPGFTRPIPLSVVKENKFRQYPKTTSQLRTFHAWLFKQLSLEDLFFEGKFFITASDVAKMYPMFELAGEHIGFNYRPVYIYNLANTINDHKVNAALQTRCDKDILKRTPYSALKEPQSSRQSIVQHAKAQAIIITENPEQLSTQLHTLAKMVQGVSSRVVLAQNVPSFEYEYESVVNKYPSTMLINATSTHCVQKFLSALHSNHDLFIFCVKNLHILDEPLDLTRYIKVLAQTNAYGCYFRPCDEFFDNVSLFEHIEENVFAWQFSLSKTSYGRTAHSLDLALYRKDSILTILEKSNCTDFKSCIASLKQYEPQTRAIGLCVLIG
jgi:hypothetical protein